MWGSSWNSLPRKITKAAFPHLLGILRRREQCQGILLCSIPNRSMPGAAPAPCPWNSGILSFYFLPIHSCFPEAQNSHLIFAAQPTVTLYQLQEKAGNLRCWHSSWEFWAYKQLPAPILAPGACPAFPASCSGKCLWNPLLNFSTACSLGKLEICIHSTSWMSLDPWT